MDSTKKTRLMGEIGERVSIGYSGHSFCACSWTVELQRMRTIKPELGTIFLPIFVASVSNFVQSILRSATPEQKRAGHSLPDRLLRGAKIELVKSRKACAIPYVTHLMSRNRIFFVTESRDIRLNGLYMYRSKAITQMFRCIMLITWRGKSWELKASVYNK